MLELALAAAFKATLSAPTHRPRVNHAWPITIRAADLGGRPIRARVTMRLLYNGIAVGKVDNGRVYTFTGAWREKKGQEIEYPPASRGQRLTFQALVTARGKTIKLNYWVQPR
ncbi:MAG: hypothetical protein E6G32_08360 [Actinobacteria bacterium]|nr:MAG: hypothetical protein E6G32_08360 [Actinomycetota bacterium]